MEYLRDDVQNKIRGKVILPVGSSPALTAENGYNSAILTVDAVLNTMQVAIHQRANVYVLTKPPTEGIIPKPKIGDVVLTYIVDAETDPFNPIGLTIYTYTPIIKEDGTFLGEAQWLRLDSFVPTPEHIAAIDSGVTAELLALIDERLDALNKNKIDRVPDAVENNLPVFDANGGIKDGGVSLDGIEAFVLEVADTKIDRVNPAADGNLPLLTDDGGLTDSGKSFASIDQQIVNLTQSKMDAVSPSVAKNFPMFKPSGMLEDSGISQQTIDDKLNAKINKITGAITVGRLVTVTADGQVAQGKWTQNELADTLASDVMGRHPNYYAGRPGSGDYYSAGKWIDNKIILGCVRNFTTPANNSSMTLTIDHPYLVEIVRYWGWVTSNTPGTKYQLPYTTIVTVFVKGNQLEIGVMGNANFAGKSGCVVVEFTAY